MSSETTHILEVWGDFACFSRPEMKVERYSYPCPTPSAARGAFEAVYFKPEFFWQVTRIELLSLPSYIALRRNEVKDKISERAVRAWMKGKGPVEPIWADGDKGLLGTDQKGRTQRQTMALRNPRYRLSAVIAPRDDRASKQAAFDQQFVRRASRGKCFQQPFLGCREFVAFFRHIEDLQGETPPKSYNQDLGLMVYDTFSPHDDNHSRLHAKKDGWKSIAPSVSLFRAKIEEGVLDIPPYDSEAVLKPGQRDGRSQ